MSDLAVRNDNSVVINEEFVIDSLKMLGVFGTLKPDQIKLACAISKEFQLNPLKREIYFISYGGKLSIITGYEIYLKRAERSGKLDGWSCVYDGKDDTATCTVHRKDWKHPLVHQVFGKEVAQTSPIWQKMRTFMVKKVAIAQAFRLAFPDELGGMPYTSDELPENMTKSVEVKKEEKKEVEKLKLVEKVAEQKEQLTPDEAEIISKDIPKANEAQILAVLDELVALGIKGQEATRFYTNVVGLKKRADLTIEDIARLNLAIAKKKEDNNE